LVGVIKEVFDIIRMHGMEYFKVIPDMILVYIVCIQSGGVVRF
jgi:hypothetical protein